MIVENKKTKINGKNKGSAFEREISRKLTLWLSGNSDPDLFWRSPSSGAKSTIDKFKGRSGKNTDGDIISISEESAWVTNNIFLECKTYKSIDILPLLNYKGNLYSFWVKAEKEAKESNKILWLIFKKNRSEIFIMVETDFFLNLTFNLKKNQFKTCTNEIICMNVRLKNQNFWVAALKTFLNYVKPEQLKKYLIKEVK